MDWALAIERNQTILLRNLAWLFAWLTLEIGESVETMPRFKKLTVLFVLRPSEAAYRRVLLVTVLVRGIVAPMITNRAARPQRSERKSGGKKRGERPLPFKLTDPRKNFDLHPDKPKYVSGPGPWVTDMWSDDPIFDRSALYAHQERMNRPAATPDDEISAVALCRRMNALKPSLCRLSFVLRFSK